MSNVPCSARTVAGLGFCLSYAFSSVIFELPDTNHCCLNNPSIASMEAGIEAC